MTGPTPRIRRLMTTGLTVIAGLMAIPVAQADTMHAECDFSNSPGEHPGGELATPGQCKLSYGAISFEIQASAYGSINQLRIQPTGLAVDNSELSAELDGSAYRAELADLDGNGWPEIYVYVSSAGSGSYGSLVAYAVNNGSSVSPIYLPPMEQSPEALEGYMGHDEFAVVENRLVRRFPIYREGDTNAAPSGGTRQLQYRLEAGEAGWVLQVDRNYRDSY
jgi:hypothetical protein